MELHNEFDVPAPVDAVWAYMLDVEKIAPCMPGAELTEVVDDRNWKGKVTVKVGPVSMSFIGAVTMQERDDAAKRVVLKADGRDSRGKGSASANVTARMEPAGNGTTVSIDTDLTITGAAAQYARGGMIQDVSGRLTQEFASCLQANIGAATQAQEGDEPIKVVTATPVRGFRLGLWAFWRAIVRFFKRLGGSKPAA
jgi:carbon monoxide dehydrogenase subunit G